MKKQLLRFLSGCGVALFWLGVWYAVSLAVRNSFLLPYPHTVFAKLLSLTLTSAFWKASALTLLRIFLGIVLAILLGVLLAVLSSVSRIANALIDPFVIVIRSTPVASFIVLLLIWLNRNTVPIVISVLIAMPIVRTNMLTGLQQMNPDLDRVTKDFGFSFGKRLRRFVIPSVAPYFVSSCQSAMGLAWKAGVAAEVLSLPLYSIGRSLYEAKTYMETDELIAWTLAVILYSILLEKAFLLLFKNRKGGAAK